MEANTTTTITPEALLEFLWEGNHIWLKTEDDHLAEVSMRINDKGDEYFIIDFFKPGKPLARYNGRERFVDFDEVMESLNNKRYTTAAIA